MAHDRAPPLGSPESLSDRHMQAALRKHFTDDAGGEDIALPARACDDDVVGIL